ncbi:hypothetical protein GXP67_18715 [Rhodocytophaga rosea]|uniref:Uncharacterized protein n=1 Tax=Rhodocytophaga rosea TaxID=2704465 RepID=A0A6C0GKM7_9BACT|nr:hypothetical protein [Rhodocytophaga rosea]QHT68529.1 hypothetical protein GXP67_18715 [Rhodocytophaga rosea]
MAFDEEKINYLSLFLNEPIYVLRPELEPSPIVLAELPVEVPEANPSVEQVVAKPVADPPLKATPAQPIQSPAPIQKPVPQKNRNKVMILFNNEHSPYLAKNEEALLKKILFSVKLDIDDVDLVNYNNIQRIEYIDLLKEKVLNQLISFGVGLTALNLELYLKKYQVERIEGVDMLLADSLSVLENSPDAKKLLWKALQHMFMK